jgi:hypothetical protein
MERVVTCLLVGAALTFASGPASAQSDEEHEAHRAEREGSNESPRWGSESTGSSSHGGHADSHASSSSDADDGGSRRSAAARAFSGSQESSDDGPTLRVPPSWHRVPAPSSPGATPLRATMPFRNKVSRPAPRRDLEVLTPAVAELERPAPAVEDRDDPGGLDVEEPVEPAPAPRQQVRERRAPVEVHVAQGTVVDVASRSDLGVASGGQALSIRPRLGAGYYALSLPGASSTADGAMGSLDAGIGLGYVFDPRIAIELRGDFLVPFATEAEQADGLDSIWLSLNMVWTIYAGRVLRPYLVVGIDMVVVPGDEDLDLDTLVAGGGQAGLGIEIMLGRRVSISLEVLGVLSGTEGEVLAGGIDTAACFSLYI